MPLFGAHMSVAGGYHNALLAARDHDCAAVQLFTKNSNQWAARELTDDEVRLFRRTLRQTKVKQTIAHDSYLINLASPKEELFRKSVEAFVVEMERAEALGLRYLVAHPGSHAGTDEETGLRNVARALDEVHRRCAGFRVRVLLETTAGQGQCLGHRFEQLAHVLGAVAEPERLGVCFDTCHVFAAGYPLAPEDDYRETMAAFDRVIGLKRLRVFHVNDSKRPLGSRVDRHAHVGRGCLGLEPFRLLVNDPRFRDRPMILETPKEEEGQDMDAINLAVLRGLVQGAANDPRASQAVEPPGR
ncbi:MAG TPA: deoxyribonuclease IV [Gemmataceae bacterium]|nr:deoxyribonuclease IV [Gemmataceae bacterium]